MAAAVTIDVEPTLNSTHVGYRWRLVNFTNGEDFKSGGYLFFIPAHEDEKENGILAHTFTLEAMGAIGLSITETEGFVHTCDPGVFDQGCALFNIIYTFQLWSYDMTMLRSLVHVPAIVAPKIGITNLACGPSTQANTTVTWGNPLNSSLGGNQLVLFRIYVSMEFAGDAPLLARYRRSGDPLSNRINDDSVMLSPANRAYTVNGCFVNSKGQATCVAPFTVYAVTVVTVGTRFRDTATVFCTTMEGVQLNPVRNPFVLEQEQDKLLLGFFPPKPHTGALSYINYALTDLNRNQTAVAMTVVNGRMNENLTQDPRDGVYLFSLTELKPYTLYDLKMQLIIIRPPGIPLFGPMYPVLRTWTAEAAPGLVGRVTVSRANDMVVVEWKPPDVTNGIIRSYSVLNSLGEVFEVGGNTTSMQLTSAHAGTFVRVRACTMDGEEYCGTYGESVAVPTSSSSSGSGAAAAATAIAVSLVLFCIVVVLAILCHRSKMRRLEGYAASFVFPEKDDWHVQRNDIQLHKTIGSGAFGTVYSGYLTTEGGSKQLVAVKSCDSEDSLDLREFVQEANLMKKISKPGHKNVRFCDEYALDFCFILV